MMKEAPEFMYYVVLPIIGAIIWLIRLDAKSSENTRAIKEIHEQLKEHLDRDDDIHTKVMETLSEIREDVGEIKGLVRNRRLENK